MFRAFLYGSYRAPRELLWLIGMLVYLALMAEAFMGYVLPWGNMSFWGAQGDREPVSAPSPGSATPLVEWIRGDYGIAMRTLDRFFALHVVRAALVQRHRCSITSNSSASGSATTCSAKKRSSVASAMP